MAVTPQEIRQIVREENRVLLERYAELRQLMSVADVAKTLAVSVRTVETIIRNGELRPLWVRGQRRFHPDSIDAYLRTRSEAN
ncbi:MAG: helix-turn-helix domain-containing protein [Rhodothermia bacterium]|nr:helix-turn-helix domain-containing protein [Rhodothermia bacterium]NNE33623.1 helix-turn-helix domain-containing protein [Rhodothermales bacterium]